MDVQIRFGKEECAVDMGQSGNYAAVEDAQIRLRGEECAVGMGQRSNSRDAVVKDAQSMLREKESA